MLSIEQKVETITEKEMRMNSIIASQGLFRFSDVFFSDCPESKEMMGEGTGNKIVSSIIEKLPRVFMEAPTPNEKCVRILGRINGERRYRYIKRDYILENDFIDAYKVFVPEANNTGKFGETLTMPTLGLPGDCSADTFLNAGVFESEECCKNFMKYYSTKFMRALLGIKKVTQHCPPTVWEPIPLQVFSLCSDINWTSPLSDIDKQLYEKYKLTQDEIDFIESTVKPME